VSEGLAGRPAPHYLVLRAARYLGVAPWELADAPAVWLDWALAAMQVEAEVEARAVERAMKRRGWRDGDHGG
jgi:hypothetical protein